MYQDFNNKTITINNNENSNRRHRYFDTDFIVLGAKLGVSLLDEYYIYLLTLVY